MDDAGQMKVWIDNRIVNGDQARISVLDHGLLYGDGIFEGMRVYSGKVFRLPDHLRRFETGARAIGLELPGDAEFITKVVLETVRAFGQPEAYIRLVATRGRGALGVDPTTCHDPQLICIVTEVRLYPEEKLARGIDLVTASLRRPSADAIDPAIKSLNYLNSVLAKREARSQGADEALILNRAGMVAEASVANVFVVRDGALATPLVSDGALPGITRASVIEIAGDLGLPASERTLGRFDLWAADEVFLTGSGARIVPVATLDARPIGPAGSGCGPITARIMDAFTHFTQDRGTPF